MALDNVPNSATYNSYVDATEIDDLVNALDPLVDISAWNALTPEQKENVVLFSTDDANSFDYKGYTSQIIISKENMMWPRTGVRYANGVRMESDEIPTFMKEYVSQRCLEILSYGPSQMNAQTVPNNVKRQKIGSLEREFFSPKDMTANTLSLTDFASYSLLDPYVQNSGNLIWLNRA